MEGGDYANRRVLVVDDQQEIHTDFDEMLRPGVAESLADELAAAFLPEEGKISLPHFELLHAMSGEEACAVVEAGREESRPVALAYVDVRMPPGIDGIETIRRIRRVDREVELVIMTAYTDRHLSEVMRNMELLHKLLYIRKPFAREEVQQNHALAGGEVERGAGARPRPAAAGSGARRDRRRGRDVRRGRAPGVREPLVREAVRAGGE